ncbi:hypothetical protein [Thermodesulforhabdus norvegica]|uniref:Flagellar hook-associated protein 3 FlgL n=1 Tax=Thermodesulforhabdus norvegica TaxID=39841 RepID=A0A1I4R544_9BACT|nr:hypothetical protein [Thermodesulforhabdus norvegica]SFM47086.1 flagellar hook-associated protein 3 FlgL [Thermodesulforhabdus norvegica]
MKVSFSTKYNSLLEGIFRKEQDISKLRESISKGKELLRPSDDPVSWYRVMNLKNLSGETEQWLENLDFATHWGEYTESRLNHLNDLLTRAREIAIKAIKVNSEETISGYVSELDEIVDEALSIARSTYLDRYVFLPWSDIDPTAAIFDPSTGDLMLPFAPDDFSESLEVRIGPQEKLRVNVDAKKVFFSEDGSTIFNHLIGLRNAIQSNDTDQISQYMGQIEEDQDRVLAGLAEAGTIMVRLDARSNALEELQIDLEDDTAELEQTDVTRMATDYQLKVLALQALYQTTSGVSSLSLVSYL